MYDFLFIYDEEKKTNLFSPVSDRAFPALVATIHPFIYTLIYDIYFTIIIFDFTHSPIGNMYRKNVSRRVEWNSSDWRRFVGS